MARGAPRYRGYLYTVTRALTMRRYGTDYGTESSVLPPARVSAIISMRGGRQAAGAAAGRVPVPGGGPRLPAGRGLADAGQRLPAFFAVLVSFAGAQDAIVWWRFAAVRKSEKVANARPV